VDERDDDREGHDPGGLGIDQRRDQQRQGRGDQQRPEAAPQRQQERQAERELQREHVAERQARGPRVGEHRLAQEPERPVGEHDVAAEAAMLEGRAVQPRHPGPVESRLRLQVGQRPGHQREQQRQRADEGAGAARGVAQPDQPAPAAGHIRRGRRVWTLPDCHGGRC
jgi:hypothetical protein